MGDPGFLLVTSPAMYTSDLSSRVRSWTATSQGRPQKLTIESATCLRIPKMNSFSFTSLFPDLLSCDYFTEISRFVNNFFDGLKKIVSLEGGVSANLFALSGFPNEAQAG